MQEVIVVKFEETDFGGRWFAAFPPELGTLGEDGLTQLFLIQSSDSAACDAEAVRLNLQEVVVSDPWKLLRHYLLDIPVRYFVSKPLQPLEGAPKRRRGRSLGFTPSGKPPMVKKTKSWSFPQADWDWIESQPNQNEVMRQAIAHYQDSLKSSPEGKKDDSLSNSR